MCCMAETLAGKRVLITGGLGFIGSNLVHACVAAKAEVTIFDCLDPRSGGNPHNILGVQDRIRLAYHDIQDFDRVSQFVANSEIVFNCAASTSHPFSMREPWLDQDINCTGTINLLEAIRRYNPKARLVHVGTSTQLGPLHYSPADEHHPEFPTDIYSANKSVSEKYVLIYAKSHGLWTTVARLTNTYGPRAAIHSPEFTFNNYFVGQCLQNKPITVFGTGAQKRNVLFVADAVEALMQLAATEVARGETYFVAGDDHFSVAEIAQATVEIMGQGELRHVDWPTERKATDFGDAVISNAKIKQHIGWSPQHDLRAGLLQTRQYFTEHRQHYLR